MKLPLSKCKDCIIKENCKLFHEKYQQAVKHVKKQIELQKEDVCDKFDSIIANNQKFWIDNKYDQYLQETLNTSYKDVVCAIEQELVVETISDLDKRYDFKKNPALNILLEQLLSLKLTGFKIGLGHNKYGAFTEFKKDGKLIPMLTPGINYSIDISDKITVIMERMDKILFGERLKIEHVETIQYEDLFKDANDGEIIEVKEIN